MPAKRIAFTFAGRQRYMESHARFMREAIRRRIIDEWHIWDFARNEGDALWLYREFGNRQWLVTGPDSSEYQQILSQPQTAAKIWISALHDAHIRISMQSGRIYEWVIGAFNNQRCILREFDSARDYVEHAAPKHSWIGGLPRSEFLMCEIDTQDSMLALIHSGLPGLMHAEPIGDDFILDIAVRTGYGARGWWSLSSPKDSAISLITTGLSGYTGFREAYLAYSDQRFSDCHFLKLDDDIVFIDLDRLDDMLIFSSEKAPHDIVSANVINNGVCAYFQAGKGYFPALPVTFEYPPNGLCGTLWESAVKCASIHRYFGRHYPAIRHRASSDEIATLLPDPDRFSINFISFGHSLFLRLALAYISDPALVDDEAIITQSLPSLFGLRKYVYNALLVAHLSFYSQESGIDVEALIGMYTDLEQASLLDNV